MIKRCLLSAFFLSCLFFLSPCYGSTVQLTDSQYQQVMQALNNSKTQLVQSKQELAELKEQSTTLSSQLKNQSEYLKQQEEILNQAIDNEAKAKRQRNVAITAAIVLGIALAFNS